jgi:hypothetical protein
MADEIRDAGSSSDEVLEQAAQHTLAANPLVGVRGRDISILHAHCSAT